MRKRPALFRASTNGQILLFTLFYKNILITNDAAYGSNVKKTKRPRSKLHAQLIPTTRLQVPSEGTHVVNFWCAFGALLVRFWCAFGALFCSSRITPVYGSPTTHSPESLYLKQTREKYS
jgi:hypothetical protein